MLLLLVFHGHPCMRVVKLVCTSPYSSFRRDVHTPTHPMAQLLFLLFCPAKKKTTELPNRDNKERSNGGGISTTVGLFPPLATTTVLLPTLKSTEERERRGGCRNGSGWLWKEQLSPGASTQASSGTWDGCLNRTG